MKRNLEAQRRLFTKKFAENVSATRTSYKIVQKVSERGEPYTDGNFNKECMMEAGNIPCVDKTVLFESISLSATSLVRRMKEHEINRVLHTREKVRNLLWHSLALDESTDLSSTSQLLVFIRGVSENMISAFSMHGTTTGKYIFGEVLKTSKYYN